MKKFIKKDKIKPILNNLMDKSSYIVFHQKKLTVSVFIKYHHVKQTALYQRGIFIIVDIVNHRVSHFKYVLLLLIGNFIHQSFQSSFSNNINTCFSRDETLLYICTIFQNLIHLKNCFIKFIKCFCWIKVQSLGKKDFYQQQKWYIKRFYNLIKSLKESLLN